MDKITGLDQVSQDFDLLISKSKYGFIYQDKCTSFWILDFGSSRPRAKRLGSFWDKLSAVKAARSFGFGGVWIQKQNHPKKKHLSRFSFEDERDWSRIYSNSLK